MRAANKEKSKLLKPYSVGIHETMLPFITHSRLWLDVYHNSFGRRCQGFTSTAQLASMATLPLMIRTAANVISIINEMI